MPPDQQDGQEVRRSARGQVFTTPPRTAFHYEKSRGIPTVSSPEAAKIDPDFLEVRKIG
jgi:hypothetical protein